MDFRFAVCGIGELEEFVKRLNPGRLVTLLDPGTEVPVHGVEDYLALEFEDIVRSDTKNPNAPQERHISELLRWGDRAIFQTQRITLVCCQAGVSRSTAAALTLIAQRYGAQDLPKAVDWLMVARPEAEPNDAMLRLGDSLLGLPGSLRRAGRIVRDRYRAQNESPMGRF